MLVCRKCHQELLERVAQQSLYEIEATLLSRNSSIAARRKARNTGPLCDPCAERWQAKFLEDSASGESLSSVDRPGHSTRSAAMERLEEACRNMTPESPR